MSGKKGAVSSRDCVEILWGFTQSQSHHELQDCREGEASAVWMKVNALAFPLCAGRGFQRPGRLLPGD